MSMSNRIGDGLNAVMNGQRAYKEDVVVPASKLLKQIFEIMKRKHYIETFDAVEEGAKRFLKVVLRYDTNGQGIITEIKRHSLSSRRVYAKSKNIPRMKNGFATVIVSTSKGVMTGKEARELKIGGEIICHIF